MTPKGTFAALPVRAQAYIIQLYEDTCKGFCQKPRYWHVANQLNYHHGMRTVSNLSAESYWFSLRRRNPTIDELLEKLFSAGEPLTILQVLYSAKDAVNVEVFSEVVKHFLAAQHSLSMRVFTVACFSRSLEWPEALSGLVRPCPKCSDYRLTADSGQERHFDSRPTAYEAFHFYNKVTGQWLTVGAPMAIPTNDGGGKNPPRQSIRRLRFWIESAPPCVFGGNVTCKLINGAKPISITRPMLAAIVLDAFGCLTRSDLETSMLVCTRWQTVVEQHGKSLPLRHIVKATYTGYRPVPTLDVRAKSPVVNGMDPVIRATFSDSEDDVSADASLLLRNSYVERLQIRSQEPEAQSKILGVLGKTLEAGDLVVGEFSSYEDHVCFNVMDTVEFLVAAARLQKLSLFITLVSFTQNYARIFDAASKTTVKYLYMDIFREFGARKQPEEAQLEPATFLAIKERWLDFVFTSMCDHAIALIRHSLPAVLPCPFAPNDIMRKFLDMDRVDHFTTCVIDGARGEPPEACTALVATRQSFVNNGFMRQLNRSVGNGLYNVYYVRNDRANETLSVLVGNTAAGIRVILMRGAFECGEEVPYPSRQDGEGNDDYEEDNDDEEEDDDEVDDEGEEEGDEGTDEEDVDDDRDSNTAE